MATRNIYWAEAMYRRMNSLELCLFWKQLWYVPLSLGLGWVLLTGGCLVDCLALYIPDIVRLSFRVNVTLETIYLYLNKIMLRGWILQLERTTCSGYCMHDIYVSMPAWMQHGICMGYTMSWKNYCRWRDTVCMTIRWDTDTVCMTIWWGT